MAHSEISTEAYVHRGQVRDIMERGGEDMIMEFYSTAFAAYYVELVMDFRTRYESGFRAEPKSEYLRDEGEYMVFKISLTPVPL